MNRRFAPKDFLKAVREAAYSDHESRLSIDRTGSYLENGFIRAEGWHLVVGAVSIGIVLMDARHVVTGFVPDQGLAWGTANAILALFEEPAA